MSTLVEKLEALKRYVILGGGSAYSGSRRKLRKGRTEWISAKDVRALLADHANEGEGDPLMVHQLEQARRNWRHWQQRAEIAEERLASSDVMPASLDLLRIAADNEQTISLDAHECEEILAFATRPAPAAPDALREALEKAMCRFRANVAELKLRPIDPAVTTFIQDISAALGTRKE